MTNARDEVLNVFADLAEEDPTVLRDLLIRIAQWETKPPASLVAGPWKLIEPGAGYVRTNVWIRRATQIGRLDQQPIARVLPCSGDIWQVAADQTYLSQHRKTLELARFAADWELTRRGWFLTGGHEPPTCGCRQRDPYSHDRTCPMWLIDHPTD